MHFTRAIFGTVAGLALCAGSALAQNGGSPSFQQPRITSRELNFGVAQFRSNVTGLILQWREGLTPDMQFTLEGGVADADARSVKTQLFAGGALAWELARASADVPLDFLLTAGAYVGGGAYRVLRIPVGVSVGHTFDLEGNLSLTPYVHPRIALESCRGCASVALDFDVGGNLQLTKVLGLRVSGIFGNSEAGGGSHDGFGISLAWTPPGLSR